MAENEVLGNYRVLRSVGDGGFARVYLGEHLYLKTYAAIKVPKLQLDASDLEDFLNEAGRGVGLRHPNVMRMLEYGVQGGTQPYIVMEYALGGSVRQRYPSGTPMPPLAIITYAKQAGAGLQYIHDQGLIHQDIKPGNMLLGSNDEVLLSDFGIAIVAHHVTAQSTSDTLGAARYMAPEQFIGKASPASDQYALAIVAYEWICGSPPFSGDIGELYYKHTHVAPPPLSTKMPMIAPSVEQVIMRALAKDPRDRFPNVQDFVSALDQAGRPGTASPLPRVSGPIRIPTPTPAPDFLMHLVEEDVPTVQTHPSVEWKRTGQETPQPYVPTQETPQVHLPFSASQNEDVIPTVISPPNLPAVGAGIPSTRPGDMPGAVSVARSLVDSQREQRRGRTVSFTSGSLPIIKGVRNRLIKIIPGKRKNKRPAKKLSLFAIARTTLDDNNQPIVGNIYNIEAGISQNSPEGFIGEPIRVRTQNAVDPLLFDILIHPSDNIELVGTWYQQLRYNLVSAEPQFITCPFRLKAPGRGYLVVHFYRERQWLKAIRFEFEGILQPQSAAAMSWR